MPPKSHSEITAELRGLMNAVVSTDKLVDYVAIIDPDPSVHGADVVRVESSANSKRTWQREKIIRMTSIERESFQVTPYEEDKIINGTKDIYRLSPTGIDNLILMFASHNKIDADAFRSFCLKHKKKIIDKLKELA